MMNFGEKNSSISIDNRTFNATKISNADETAAVVICTKQILKKGAFKLSIILDMEYKKVKRDRISV